MRTVERAVSGVSIERETRVEHIHTSVLIGLSLENRSSNRAGAIICRSMVVEGVLPVSDVNGSTASG